MNAHFLRDLADKTRRGLRGRVELGKSDGGNSYGYDVVKQFEADAAGRNDATRLKASEVLRSLVEEIVLTPQDDELKIDVRGNLAGILAIALKTKTPATGTGVSQVDLVAGIGFEPMTFRL